MSRPAYLSECMGPLWIPRLWEEINNNDHLKYSNCYTYAFNYVEYGDGKLQHKDIIEKEEIILKDLFPNLPKDWNKKTLVFNSMTKIKLKSLPKKAPDNLEKKMQYHKDLIQQEKDIIQSEMYKRFKGQSLIYRSNLETLEELNKDAKALDKFKTKYPELHASLFSSEEPTKDH